MAARMIQSTVWSKVRCKAILQTWGSNRLRPATDPRYPAAWHLCPSPHDFLAHALMFHTRAHLLIYHHHPYLYFSLRPYLTWISVAYSTSMTGRPWRRLAANASARSAWRSAVPCAPRRITSAPRIASHVAHSCEEELDRVWAQGELPKPLVIVIDVRLQPSRLLWTNVHKTFDHGDIAGCALRKITFVYCTVASAIEACALALLLPRHPNNISVCAGLLRVK